MVMTLIDELKQTGKEDATLLKKLFVVVGLLYRENRIKSANKVNVAKSALDDLLDTTSDNISTDVDRKMVEDPWKGIQQTQGCPISYANTTALHNVSYSLEPFPEYVPLDVQLLRSIWTTSVRSFTLRLNHPIRLMSKSIGVNLGQNSKFEVFVKY